MLPKVYIGELKEGVGHIPLLYPNLGGVNKPDRLFLNQALHISENKIVEISKIPEEADVIVVPHDYFVISKDQEYVKRYSDLARRLSKKLVVFDYSDLDTLIDIPDAIIYRTSQYKSSLRKNEEIMPPVVEDLGLKYEIKSREYPLNFNVGFCGWVNYSNIQKKIKNFLKSIIAFKFGSRKKGLYFRKQVINALGKSSIVNTNFILRDSFSGHKSTVEGDPVKLRDEYVKNMQESDLALTVKGDGNYSLRFYEALSLGRVPLFIDTDCALPLENEIVYDDFMIRIDWKDISDIDTVLRLKLKEISPEKFSEMQKKAREIFEKYLNHESFLRLKFKDSTQI